MDVAEFLGLEVMKSAKGRDKIAAFAQNFGVHSLLRCLRLTHCDVSAKWHSLRQDIGSPHNAKWRATELNMFVSPPESMPPSLLLPVAPMAARSSSGLNSSLNL